MDLQDLRVYQESMDIADRMLNAYIRSIGPNDQ